MKRKYLLLILSIIVLVSSCTKTGNTITATNTVTVTLNAGTSGAQNINLNSVPSTSTLANGTPFIINSTGYSGSSTITAAITLNNPNCSYPNFVSGTYNLCGEPPFTNAGTSNCASGTNNSIIVTGANNSITNNSSSNSGSVTINFNNGVATGTFRYKAYSNLYQLPDSSLVTGSFSVSY